MSQDLGVLSAVGAREVPVVRRPEVAVIVTGDELLAPGTPARGVQIPDMNAVMLGALIARDCGLARIVGPQPDDRDGLRAAIAGASGSADAVLISGNSSTGPEDNAPGLVAGLGELAAHGVELRPASPAGLGFLGAVPVVLLPGNPVSYLFAYDFFAGPIVRLLGGRPRKWPYRPVVLPLARKLVSVIGRVDYARVRIERGQVEPLASSGASILSSTTRPTDSSSSRPTWKNTRRGLRSLSGSMESRRRDPSHSDAGPRCSTEQTRVRKESDQGVHDEACQARTNDAGPVGCLPHSGLLK